ncbi:MULTISPECIES: c-type cytochrome [Ramlibacter]|uniref:C-type cytochrome n=1 Tax=Ramlibacter pinisoli TaxID=2682844 RepID=A0A6N8IY72_9BURK|nr:MULTISPECIES: c-type cytochrome [Ramlibacter]MBA2960940.1 c-type cytochrome [Ramlibacter sp. CGMCC 1.13660]MVQ30886.1 c-type cytochrome [Ramlibacter pinisoli]
MPPIARHLVAALCCAGLLSACGGGGGNSGGSTTAASFSPQLLASGQQIFRFDTFGDEAQWTDALRMHEVIEQAVSPAVALSVGLKVDAQALPPALVAAIQAGQVDLGSPAATLALLKLDAVVGVKGQVESVNGVDRLRRVGITCALCHSTVDDSFAKGIGKRLDGWPNRDLDPGAIIALSPALDAKARAVYSSWGKGKFDPRFNVDGVSRPVVIPPAFGLAGIPKVTFTGDGDSPAYWNRYVSVVEMGGQGSFVEPRLNLSITHGTQDLVSSKLPALEAYQLSLAAPAAPVGSFDPAAALRGQLLFAGKAQCVTCHSGATFTDAASRLHPPGDSVADPESPSYASRSATGQYRTTPLRGAWQHPPYLHDGSAATFDAVVDRYNQRMGLGLSQQEIADVAQYLKSL